MIDIVPAKSCIGCHACESICGPGAIKMHFNDKGFLYPHVDKEMCTQCEECLSVCPALNEVKFKRLPSPDVFAAWSKSDEIIKASSSGGIFSELAFKALDDEGVVFGAAFDTNLNLLHCEIDKRDDLPSLRCSKYLQSNMAGVFQKVQCRLENGQNVLFVGTPCQVAGLNSFLGRDNTYLLTCDLICHGVAAPGLFSKYINELHGNHQARILSFQFRAKPHGWRNYYFDITFDNGDRIQEPFPANAFMKGFLADLYLRPSCYDCKYSRLPRVADITLGDFWGIWNYRPDLDDDTGTSVVLINSSKAREYLLKCDFKVIHAELDWVIAGNPSLISSAKAHKRRKKFFKLLAEGRKFEELINSCLPPPNYLDKVIWSINRRLKRFKHDQ